jgi:hypothetical protein
LSLRVRLLEVRISILFVMLPAIERVALSAMTVECLPGTAMKRELGEWFEPVAPTTLFEKRGALLVDPLNE